MARSSERILLARIGRAHGIRGEVRVNAFTENPLAFGEYGPLFDSGGRPFELLSVHEAGKAIVARFAGIEDRDAAEAVNGTDLFVERADLPEIGESETWYHADLIGSEIVDTGGARLGTLRAIHDYGAGDILEIALETGGELMLPFSREYFPSVEPGDRRITIADGWDAES